MSQYRIEVTMKLSSVKREISHAILFGIGVTLFFLTLGVVLISAKYPEISCFEIIRTALSKFWWVVTLVFIGGPVAGAVRAWRLGQLEKSGDNLFQK